MVPSNSLCGMSAAAGAAAREAGAPGEAALELAAPPLSSSSGSFWPGHPMNTCEWRTPAAAAWSARCLASGRPRDQDLGGLQRDGSSVGCTHRALGRTALETLNLRLLKLPANRGPKSQPPVQECQPEQRQPQTAPPPSHCAAAGMCLPEAQPTPKDPSHAPPTSRTHLSS